MDCTRSVLFFNWQRINELVFKRIQAVKGAIMEAFLA